MTQLLKCKVCRRTDWTKWRLSQGPTAPHCRKKLSNRASVCSQAWSSIIYNSSVKSLSPSSSHVWMWELDHKEDWVPKNWCFWTVVLEKTLESSLDCKIKPINPKGNQSWLYIGRTGAEAEVPILWPPDAELTLWKRPWCWERLRARGEGDDRGWDGWMLLLTQRTWVWANSRRKWKTEGWCVAVHRVTKSWTQLHNWTTTTSKQNLMIAYCTRPWKCVVCLGKKLVKRN